MWWHLSHNFTVFWSQFYNILKFLACWKILIAFTLEIWGICLPCLQSPSPSAILGGCILNSLLAHTACSSAHVQVPKVVGGTCSSSLLPQATTLASGDPAALIPSLPNTTVFGPFSAVYKRAYSSNLSLFFLSLCLPQSLSCSNHCPTPPRPSSPQLILLWDSGFGPSFLCFWCAEVHGCWLLIIWKAVQPRGGKGESWWPCSHPLRSPLSSSRPQFPAKQGVLTGLFMKLALSPSLKMPVWWPAVTQQKYGEHCEAQQGYTASERAYTLWFWPHSAVKINIGLMASSRKKTEWVTQKSVRGCTLLLLSDPSWLACIGYMVTGEIQTQTSVLCTQWRGRQRHQMKVRGWKEP